MHHPIVHDVAIFAGSSGECIANRKENTAQLLGQFLETVKLRCKLRGYVLKPSHIMSALKVDISV